MIIFFHIRWYFLIFISHIDISLIIIILAFFFISHCLVIDRWLFINREYIDNISIIDYYFFQYYRHCHFSRHIFTLIVYISSPFLHTFSSHYFFLSSFLIIFAFDACLRHYSPLFFFHYAMLLMLIDADVWCCCCHACLFYDDMLLDDAAIIDNIDYFHIDYYWYYYYWYYWYAFIIFFSILIFAFWLRYFRHYAFFLFAIAAHYHYAFFIFAFRHYYCLSSAFRFFFSFIAIITLIY